GAASLPRGESCALGRFIRSGTNHQVCRDKFVSTVECRHLDARVTAPDDGGRILTGVSPLRWAASATGSWKRGRPADEAAPPAKPEQPRRYPDKVDDTLDDSFPASDPPSWAGA